jgi:cation diffusion facilitator family transporter
MVILLTVFFQPLVKLFLIFKDYNIMKLTSCIFVGEYYDQENYGTLFSKNLLRFQFMQWIRDFTPQPEQKRLYNQAIVVTLAGNILLVIGKSLAAYISGSVAIYADAANSISDVFYSFLMALGLRVTQKPPDISHPQGHSRFEPVIGMGVAIAMGVAGYEALHAAIARYLSGSRAIEPLLPTIILLTSAIIKAGMYLFINRIAIKVASPSLRVTATDNLSDVLTSVAAILGVVGSKYIYPLLDPIAGLLVAAWIFRAVFRAGYENLKYLTGAGASTDLRDQIIKVTESVPGVIKVHHLVTDYAGPKIVIELHVNVDGNITLSQAHTISDAISAKLTSLPEVDRAYVHIEPDE